MWQRLLNIQKKSQPQGIPTGATALGQAFMQRYPDYPVIKVRVAPGEAYIAPTENMIHDASTVAKRVPDLHLTFLGHIGPGAPTVLNMLGASVSSSVDSDPAGDSLAGPQH